MATSIAAGIEARYVVVDSSPLAPRDVEQVVV